MHVWIKVPLVHYGDMALPRTISEKLNIVNVRKFAKYAKSKGAVPRVSFVLWRRIATEKYGIPKQYAWSLFEMFEVLFQSKGKARQERIFKETRIRREALCHGDAADVDLNALEAQIWALRDESMVNCAAFMVYLYLQHLLSEHHASKQVPGLIAKQVNEENVALDAFSSSSPPLGGQELHGSNASLGSIASLSSAVGDADLNRSTSPGGGNTPYARYQAQMFREEKAVTDLVRDNLHRFLQVVDPDARPPRDGKPGSQLSESAVAALDFLLSATEDPSRGTFIQSLVDALRSVEILPATPRNQRGCRRSGSPSAAGQVVYDTVTHTYSFSGVVQWIGRHLGTCPFTIGGALNRPLSPAEMAQESPRLAAAGQANSIILPLQLPGYSGPYTILQENNITTAHYGREVRGHNVNIVGCSKSSIYLLDVCANVHLRGLRKCTIFIGAAERCVKVERCKEVTIVVACGKFLMRHCQDLVVHLHTNSQPYVGEGVINVMVAPHQSYYGHLQEDLQVAGINSELNYWNDPVNFAVSERRTSSGLGSAPRNTVIADIRKIPFWPSGVHVLAPEAYMPVSVPFETGGVTEDPVLFIPREYATAMEQRVQRMERVRQAIIDAQLDDEKRPVLQKELEHRFQEWLVETGNQRHVQQVVRMARESQHTV